MPHHTRRYHRPSSRACAILDGCACRAGTSAPKLASCRADGIPPSRRISATLTTSPEVHRMTNLSSRLELLEQTLWRRLGLERFHGFVVANKGLMIYLAAVAVAAFGYDFFTFSLKIDSEFHALEPGAKMEWITQGRWAMYYLNAWLLPDPVMPFLPMLTGLIGACVRRPLLPPVPFRATHAIRLSCGAARYRLPSARLWLLFHDAELRPGYRSCRGRCRALCAHALAMELRGVGDRLFCNRHRHLSVDHLADARACSAFYLVVQIIAVPHVTVGWLIASASACSVPSCSLAYGLYELIKTATLACLPPATTRRSTCKAT